jgi:hypothetical protein
MKKIIIIIAISLFAFSCEHHDLSTSCYHGKVIMSSCCSGSTFISIETPIRIGKDTKLIGQNYSNVIQVPGYLTGPNIYLNLRKYDSQKDVSLFLVHCYCLISEVMDVPIFVATSFSTTECPNQASLY